jgi:hypothetical protein
MRSISSASGGGAGATNELLLFNSAPALILATAEASASLSDGDDPDILAVGGYGVTSLAFDTPEGVVCQGITRGGSGLVNVEEITFGSSTGIDDGLLLGAANLAMLPALKKITITGLGANGDTYPANVTIDSDGHPVPKLQELSVSAGGMAGGSVAITLGDVRSLTTLTIADPCTGGGTCDVNLGAAPKLTTLSLTDASGSTSGFSLYLKNAETLETLAFGDNLGAQGYCDFAITDAAGAPELKTLTFGNGCATTEGVTMPAFSKMPKLETLTFGTDVGGGETGIALPTAEEGDCLHLTTVVSNSTLALINDAALVALVTALIAAGNEGGTLTIAAIENSAPSVELAALLDELGDAEGLAWTVTVEGYGE